MELKSDFPDVELFKYDLNKVHEYDTFITKAKEPIAGYFTKFNNSKDTNEFLRKFVYNEDRMIIIKEYFYIILLNNSNIVTGFQKISEGGINVTHVDVRFIAKAALDVLASSVVLVHNHPSGSMKASDSDITLTKRIKEALNLFNIKIIDHIIITKDSYYSFADEGIL